jgi:hypothetical protein
MSNQGNRKEASREQFTDGSALVTYQDGSVLLLESSLAKVSNLQETRSITYNDPPPAAREPKDRPETHR